MRPALADAIARMSPVSWQHLNRQGKFNFLDAEHLARLAQGGRPLQAARLGVFTSSLPPAADAAVRRLPHLAAAERLLDGRY